MQLADRRLLEIEIDKLLKIRDFNIETIARQASESLKARKFEDAKRYAEQARALYKPPVPVLDLLVSKGGIKSKAQARRMVQSGAVYVDGVRLRKIDVKILPHQEVTAGGILVQAKPEE